MRGELSADTTVSSGSSHQHHISPCSFNINRASHNDLVLGISIDSIGTPGYSLYETKPPDKLDSLYRAYLNSLQPEIPRKPPLVECLPVEEISKEGEPVHFYAKSEEAELLYRTYKAEARLVRAVLERSGFSCTETDDWNVLWACAPIPNHLYSRLNSYQRINHFPCSTEITKKDRLAYSLLRMSQRYGSTLFNFAPETFVLPTEFPDFHTAFASGGLWIVKPVNSSQGKGIYIIDNIQDVPLEEPCVVSRYLSNPLTANGLKFDIRLYVLITCYEPLRIYLYEEGLVRFASETYQTATTESKYVHLTNYSVNKKNKKFVGNQDFRCDDVGHKWSVSALCKKLRTVGADVDTMWAKIYDLVIKTVLSAESANVDATRRLNIPKNCCFDLLGFDILIDRDLKPWLLEVNLSPSLNTDSPLDLFIKANLIADTLNLVGIRAFNRRTEGLSKLRTKLQSKKPKSTHSVANFSRSVSPSRGTREKDSSREAIEEYLRKGRYLRIYPNKASDYYDVLFNTQRASNRLLQRKLKGIEGEPEGVIAKHKRTSSFDEDSISQRHLNYTPAEDTNIAFRHLPIRPEKPDKPSLTGDEILIEYVERLIHVLKSLDEDSINLSLKTSFEQFLNHYVWKSSDQRRGGANLLWQRLEARLIEMKERRKRLVSMVYKRQGVKAPEQDDIAQEVLRTLNASQLEQLLKQHTRDAAHELISCLIDSRERGALSELIRMLAISAKQGSPIKIRSTVYRRDSRAQAL
mmetsp:Transcript_19719/g.36326  ORF Transcript_19719/g.36326 Transcript_19719/m.36326 type:complete len:749 (-) Transcript_19719:1583-3829(-)